MMRVFSVCIVLLLAAALTLVACQFTNGEPSAEATSGMHQVQAATLGAQPMTLADKNVYLGAQPTRADFAAAARYPGIRTVLDLRRESENRGFDEARQLNELDVEYQNVPCGGPEQLTDEVLDRSLHVIETGQRPLLVHCASGNRVGAVWMAWRMLKNGYSEERALAEAREVGLRNDGFIPVVLDYVQRHRPEAPER